MTGQGNAASNRPQFPSPPLNHLESRTGVLPQAQNVIDPGNPSTRISPLTMNPAESARANVGIGLSASEPRTPAGRVQSQQTPWPLYHQPAEHPSSRNITVASHLQQATAQQQAGNSYVQQQQQQHQGQRIPSILANAQPGLQGTSGTCARLPTPPGNPYQNNWVNAQTNRPVSFDRTNVPPMHFPQQMSVPTHNRYSGNKVPYQTNAHVPNTNSVPYSVHNFPRPAALNAMPTGSANPSNLPLWHKPQHRKEENFSVGNVCGPGGTNHQRVSQEIYVANDQPMCYNGCGKAATQVCRGCGDSFYCPEKACQQQHWDSGHKVTCVRRDLLQ